MRLTLSLLLCLACAGSTVRAAAPINVYQSCVMPDGVVGACRMQPRVVAGPSDVQAGAALELPIDMRLPCQDANRTCAENVDLALTPIRPPSGDDISSCSVTLMPWSPFPCTYNTEAYKGVEGQNKTSWCYSKSTRPATAGYENVRDLVTDGYSNLFHGYLPPAPCGQPPSARVSSSSDVGAAGQQPGYGRHFTKVLLTVNFRVAAGRQFDRTFSFQVGRTVAAIGTLTEPTRWLGTDKWWTTTTDITHLQPYLAPDLPTRLSLANLLSNTYNVPLWAEVKLDYYWQQQQQQVSSNPVASLPPLSNTHPPAAANTPATHQGAASSNAEEGSPVVPGGAAATTGPVQQQQQQMDTAPPADVPDEVVPLIPNEDDAEALVVLEGGGSDGSAWPRATFSLPAALSEPGNIYRAQLLVTPKADACEEFWAMNPSGPGTNNTCGGVTTGEPYREVRVYVNGQLAGFSPIYYTMYTGGMDPRLWSAIVASYAYQLPTYTFDLSPWLAQLNTLPQPSSNRGHPTASATDSSGAHGSSVESDIRLPAMLQRPSPSRKLTTSSGSASQASQDVPLDTLPAHDSSTPRPKATEQQPQQHQDTQQQVQQPKRSVAVEVPDGSRREGAHTISVELGGATGSRWFVANTLLLWRAVGPQGQPQVVTGQQSVQVETSPGFHAPLQSRCEATAGQLAVAGRCSLDVGDRRLTASSVLQWQGQEWQARVTHATTKYENVITFNNDVNVTDGSITWYQKTNHEAAWSLTPRQHQQHQDNNKAQLPPSAAAAAAALAGIVTQHAVQSDWLNTGNVTAGGAFEYSFNVTRLQPTVYATPAAAAHSAAAGSVDSKGHTASSTGAQQLQQGGVSVVTGGQQHYQLATMLNVYTPTSPKCVVPDNATHTVSLHNSMTSSSSSSAESDSSMGGSSRPQMQAGAAAAVAVDGRSCVGRWGSAGFCCASLMKNVIEWDAQGC